MSERPNGEGIEQGGALHALLRRAVDVRPDEVRALLTSFAFFFFLLSSYFVLRPIRDAVAAASGARNLSWLFAGTLTVTLIFNPLFSGLVVRFPIRRVIPISYHFFVANLLAFYLVLRSIGNMEGSTAGVWIGRAFFIWTTVFALFNTSIFWSLMADAFRSDQAKRMFGFIGVGGTLGSIVGSATTAALAKQIGAMNLLIVSAALLEVAIFTIVRFPLQAQGGGIAKGRRRRGDMALTAEFRAKAQSAEVRNHVDEDGDVIGGSVWAGFTEVLRSPYLLGICAFLIFYTVGSTILYFAQADIVGRTYADTAARTAILAKLELAAQVLTVITQIFFTGRIIRWVGLAVTLALLPAMSILGFSALGAIPTFATLAIFTVLRRASNFALTNPAMEVLFTVVPREDKYKAKNIIETFVYRGGDQLGAWGYAKLAAIGLSLAAISFLAVPLAVLWLFLALWLGKRQAAMAGVAEGRPAKVPGEPAVAVT